MASKTMKSAFMTGVHYLNHQQYRGDSLGGMQMINRRLQFSKNLYNKDLYAHYGCVNAVEFSNDGEWLVSGGDDKRVLLWNVDKTLSCSYKPKAMKGEHNSNIFCLGFNSSHSKLFSAGNDEQVILHDVNTGEILDVFLHDEAVYGLSVDPINENIFVSACDDGRVLIWDIRQTSSDACTLANCSSAYHAVMYNPVESRYVASANAKDGVCLWDLRKPKVAAMKYGSSSVSQSAMSVRFNSMGTHLLALRRRLPPVLYDVGSGHAAAEFDHPEYYNSCTMKSCCFAGERDQYVLSGSDDFKLYVWKVPDNLNAKKRSWVSNAHFVLRGHRSIVNQVRYNNAYGILASSGVEKIVKLWSSFPISHNEATTGYVTNKDLSRKVYSHEEYINLVLESGQFMTHDYSHHSVQEDPRMMAFFDSLVQRDIEGWTSDSSDATDIFTTCFEVQTSDSSHSSSSSSSSDSESELPTHNELLSGTGSNILYAYQNAQIPDTFSSTLPLETETISNRTTSEETDETSIDRISQLIAQKRRETKWKTARATMTHSDFKMMKKTLKKSGISHVSDIKLEKKSKISHLSQNASHSNEDDETKIASHSSATLKDKRKLLCKKRAKLSKEAIFVDSSSSDSDSSSTEIDLNSNAQTDKKSTENDCSLTLENSEENTVDVNNGADHKESSNIDTILPNPSSNGLSETAAIPTNSWARWIPSLLKMPKTQVLQDITNATSPITYVNHLTDTPENTNTQTNNTSSETLQTHHPLSPCTRHTTLQNPHIKTPNSTQAFNDSQNIETSTITHEHDSQVTETPNHNIPENIETRNNTQNTKWQSRRRPTLKKSLPNQLIEEKLSLIKTTKQHAEEENANKQKLYKLQIEEKQIQIEKEKAQLEILELELLRKRSEFARDFPSK